MRAPAQLVLIVDHHCRSGSGAGRVSTHRWPRPAPGRLAWAVRPAA